jgi:hypothetical protein
MWQHIQEPEKNATSEIISPQYVAVALGSAFLMSATAPLAALHC